MSDLAILGGEPVRRRPFPPWPQHSEGDARRLAAVLESGNWGGYPYPNALAGEFARRFAEYHGARYGACVANGTIALLVALQAAGIRFVPEGYVDLDYDADGKLILERVKLPRDPAETARRAVASAHEGRVQSICIHGDGPNAVELAAAVRSALVEAGVDVAPL